MYLPLILDLKDNKWSMLKEVLKFFDSRVAHQELAKRNIPVKNGVNAFKIVLTLPYLKEMFPNYNAM